MEKREGPFAPPTSAPARSSIRSGSLARHGSWNSAAAAKRDDLDFFNINSSNGDKSTTLFLDTREGPLEKVRMHASRPAGAKMVKVEISSPLPKPVDTND